MVMRNKEFHNLPAGILLLCSLANSTGEPVYRKVAVVENFFDIIYNVHVELEGRPGKHAGQKRTYRTSGDMEIRLFGRKHQLSVWRGCLCGALIPAAVFVSTVDRVIDSPIAGTD
ncbi:hypothetical protein GEV33_004868 [Tenebrio molitor]|uniref:Uncharacterized protein n=1 Tax=Tenebrio molitor TaxID=7067 RepID=A0A8J6HQQ4_TENMO|nr:hypothetical protein GEV33_004868 [Tenebrio molitor]